MPKKKSKNKNIPQDFTINDSANASKPVTKQKKSSTEVLKTELAWDEVDDDFDIIEEVDIDGAKTFVYKKKRTKSKCDQFDIEDRPGNVYPEVIWYQVSRFIEPEDIGTFAGINQATYNITKRESFWRSIYKKYCKNSPKLPGRLRIENSFKSYGLRQRVIRALYHTYKVFTQRIMRQAAQDSKPHELVKRRCVNVWFHKGFSNWSIYFKFKKLDYFKVNENVGFLEELGKIDANPDDGTQVLEVTCLNFYQVSPTIMGMTLSSVSVVLSQGFRHHKVLLGFNSALYSVSRDILPECSVTLDNVLNTQVFDWWHPRYPHFDNKVPASMRDEEALPVLKKDFFANADGEA